MNRSLKIVKCNQIRIEITLFRLIWLWIKYPYGAKLNRKSIIIFQIWCDLTRFRNVVPSEFRQLGKGWFSGMEQLASVVREAFCSWHNGDPNRGSPLSPPTNIKFSLNREGLKGRGPQIRPQDRERDARPPENYTPRPVALKKLSFHFLSNWMGYDRRNSFPLDFETNENPFGSENRKENCHNDHIPFYLGGNGMIVFSVGIIAHREIFSKSY